MATPIIITSTPACEVFSLEGEKAALLTRVRDYFNGVVESLKADAAPYEVATWETQRAEYAAWMTDAAVATPYVDGLCAARGIDKPELMEKIGAKVAGMATVQGTQHRMEKAIEAAQSLDELLDIASTMKVGL